MHLYSSFTLEVSPTDNKTEQNKITNRKPWEFERYFPPLSKYLFISSAWQGNLQDFFFFLTRQDELSKEKSL